MVAPLGGTLGSDNPKIQQGVQGLGRARGDRTTSVRNTALQVQSQMGVLFRCMADLRGQRRQSGNALKL